MIIYESDTEERRKSKRAANLEEQKQEHILGVQHLLAGIPIDCKVEQPIAQQAHISSDTYIRKDTAFTNGLVRQAMYDGDGNKYHDNIFAGNARETFLQGERNQLQELGSLGTNTLDIEGKLRARKSKLRWKEPERRKNRSGKGGRPKTNLNDI